MTASKTTMDSGIALYSDLQELILGLLLEDFPIILKCCLVCKDWQLFCRPRIFGTLDFSSRKGRQRFHGFVELLGAPVVPSFAPYVEHITLDDRVDPGDIEALDASQLVRLFSLSVKNEIKDAVASADYFKAISKHFSHITHLDITRVTFIAPATLSDFICSFNELRTLAFSGTRCLGVSRDPHRDIEERHWRLPPLTSLCISMELGETLEETFFHWLGDQLLSQKSLQTLRLLGVVTQPDHIQTLMECVSPYLEELELDVRPFSVLNGLGSSGLSLPRLKTWKLGIPISSDQLVDRESEFPGDESNAMGRLSTIDLPIIAQLSNELFQAKASQLQELIFTLFEPSETGHLGSLFPLETLHRIQFTELDRKLSKSQDPFPNLHTVSFPCEEHVPTPRDLEPSGSLPNDSSACRTPPLKQHREPFCSEPIPPTFFETAFPLTFAQGSITLQVLNASQGASQEALF